MNAERIAIAGWGVLETEADESPRWLRPWKNRLAALGRFVVSAFGVAMEAVLVLLPRI